MEARSVVFSLGCTLESPGMFRNVITESEYLVLIPGISTSQNSSDGSNATVAKAENQ